MDSAHCPPLYQLRYHPSQQEEEEVRRGRLGIALNCTPLSCFSMYAPSGFLFYFLSTFLVDGSQWDNYRAGMRTDWADTGCHYLL